MAVTRDDVENDRLRKRMREEVARGAEHPLLTDEEFDESRARIIAQFADEEELWIFGYGSLIWSPTFKFVDSQVAILRGHSRKFCLWAVSGRGDPETPGLWLGLDTGTECTGIAFRVDNSERDYETLMLWRREMISGAYRPEVLPVEINGENKACICLLANKEHPRYTGELPDERVVQAIASGRGHLGTCCEYLFNVTDKLDSIGVHDQDLRDLCDAVRAYQAENPSDSSAA